MSGFTRSTTHWPGSLLYGCQGNDGCCNGFFRLEKITTTGSLGSTLNNDIHPLLAVNAFNGLPVADLEIALRLASLLIEASLPFWHSIMFGNVVRTGLNSDKGSNFDLHEQVREHNDMEEEQKADTRAGLEELAAHIKFALNTDDPDLNDTVTSERISDSDLFNGHRSTIYLGQERIDSLYQETDDAHHLVNLLLLAKDICHELAHAVLYASWPDATGDTDYTFFDDLAVAEEGFAWENRTFGGLLRTMIRPAHVAAAGDTIGSETDLYQIDGVPSTLQSSMICMTEWPNLEAVQVYQDNLWPLGVKQSAQVADPYMVWNVPFGFISKLFRKEFWEHEYTPGRHDALHVPLTTGYRYRCTVHEASRFRGVPPQEFAHVVPSGYTIGPEGGLVLPAGQDVQNVIPSE